VAPQLPRHELDDLVIRLLAGQGTGGAPAQAGQQPAAAAGAPIEAIELNLVFKHDCL
jgi:hypothetical protein